MSAFEIQISDFGFAMLDAFFLDPARADTDGLVGIGGDLGPERLLHAYRRGIFPFYDDSSPILWWSPDPRGIIELDGLHVSRRLARTVRSGRFAVTFDRDFPGVIAGCADRPGHGNWIVPEMMEAYTRLHDLGHAHSVEVWRDGLLAGGVYGVAVGGLYAGESMFSRQPDASKVALVHLVDHLRQRGYQFLDVQYVNDHTSSLGALEIPRRDYLARLRRAVACPVTFL
jgi:leucyl/phenylalanyl-tRNA--protein transferase